MGVISPVRLYYPQSCVIFARYGLVTVGNALAIVHEALQDFAHYCRQNPPADGDTRTYNFYLGAGAYTLNVLGYTNVSVAKIDWYIDGVLVVAGQDWYSAGLIYNVVTTAAVTVYGHGQHVLTGVVNGRNGLATAWFLPLTAIALY